MNNKLVLVGVAALAFIGGWVIGNQQSGRTPALDAGREEAPESSSRGPLDLSQPADLTLDRAPASAVSLETTPPPANAQSGAVELEVADEGEAAAWLAEYKSLNAEQLDELAAETVNELYIASKDEFEIRFEGGLYEVLGKGNKWDGQGWNQALVMQVKLPSDLTSEIKRVVLSESEFPDFYLLKRKELWARDRAKTLRAELAAAKKK